MLFEMEYSILLYIWQLPQTSVFCRLLQHTIAWGQLSSPAVSFVQHFLWTISPIYLFYFLGSVHPLLSSVFFLLPYQIPTIYLDQLLPDVLSSIFTWSFLFYCGFTYKTPLSISTIIRKLCMCLLLKILPLSQDTSMGLPPIKIILYCLVSYNKIFNLDDQVNNPLLSDDDVVQLFDGWNKFIQCSAAHLAYSKWFLSIFPMCQASFSCKQMFLFSLQHHPLTSINSAPFHLPYLYIDKFVGVWTRRAPSATTESLHAHFCYIKKT